MLESISRDHLAGITNAMYSFAEERRNIDYSSSTPGVNQLQRR